MSTRFLIAAFLLAWQGAADASAQAVPHDHAAMEHAAMERLGKVSFQTSCNTAAQPLFDRAVALMHSFQFGPAIEGYRSVLEADPSCAIAYWGIALSSWSNPFAGFKSPAQLDQGLKAVDAGRRLKAKTQREQAYIEAVAHLYVNADRLDQPARTLAYEQAMEQLAADYPQDTEARIFYALALAAAADPADKTYAKQLKAGAILETLFAQYPDHPGLAHYIIHAYDEPALASRAAEAAKRYGAIAPSTPHALHMPSHTFTRIGDWQASIDTNLASAASARAAGQPADELHASDYMIYAYLQTGQDRAAAQLADASAQVFLRFDPAKANGAAPASAAYFARAAIPARYALERGDWAQAAKLEPVPSRFPYADSITYFARGLGAAHLKNAAGTRAAIGSLDQIHDRLAAQGEDYWAQQTDIQRREVAAILSLEEGHVPEALAGMRAAADLEGKTQLASVTPGPLAPAREMLGQMLLTQGQSADALQAFEASLMQEPNRFWSLYGAAEAARRTGDSVKAHAYFQKLLAQAPNADQPERPQLIQARQQTEH
ncbi:tetratricopeptide repeat protein [Pseudoxanthomonas sp. UC19_8]|uniref:tetratricopeptide repeat protein n=1 Tax=Pseudoxanthomonas sp. UC19_8 TaxID=3350175 RepID=UPI0036D3FF65